MSIEAKQNQPIDMEFFRTVTNGNIEFEKELLEIFMDSAKSNIAKIEKALVDVDETAWAMACHALKGSSKSIGAFDLGDAVEICHRTTQETEDRVRSLEEVKKQLKKIEEFMTTKPNS